MTFFVTSQFKDDDEEDEGDIQSPDFFDDAIEDLEGEEPSGSNSQGDNQLCEWRASEPIRMDGYIVITL